MKSLKILCTYFQYITNLGTKFIFRTNKNAANYKLVTIDFDHINNEWFDLIPEHPNDVLDWATRINEDKLVLCYLRDVKVKCACLFCSLTIDSIYAYRIPCRCIYLKMEKKYMISQLSWEQYLKYQVNIIIRKCSMGFVHFLLQISYTEWI